MVRHAAAGAARLVAAAAFLATPAIAQIQPMVSSTRPISPTVVASFLTRGDQLVLLTLWRGSPGWFWRSAGGQSGTSSSGGGGSAEEFTQQIAEGGLTFRIDYNLSAGTATLLGRSISLKEVNVVLIDGVDAPGGPTIAGTLRTDPRVGQPSGDFHPEETIVRRHRNLYEFLQCGLQLPAGSNVAAPLQEAMLAASCDRMRP